MLIARPQCFLSHQQTKLMHLDFTLLCEKDLKCFVYFILHYGLRLLTLAGPRRVCQHLWTDTVTTAQPPVSLCRQGSVLHHLYSIIVDVIKICEPRLCGRLQDLQMGTKMISCSLYDVSGNIFFMMQHFKFIT